METTDSPETQVGATVAPEPEEVGFIDAGDVKNSLDEQEREELIKCEETIKRSELTQFEAGKAFRDIRDKRLYREAYGTFEAYCNAKGYSPGHVYRLINATKLYEQLHGLEGLPAPTNETQIRPLLGLDIGKVDRAWRKANKLAGGGRVTAAHVTKAVSTLLGKKDETPKRRGNGKLKTLLSLVKKIKLKTKDAKLRELLTQLEAKIKVQFNAAGKLEAR